MDVDSGVVYFAVGIGRPMLAAMLLVGGGRQLLNGPAMQKYATSRGVPFAAVLVPISTVILLGTGGFIAVGAWADLAALIAIVFYAPTLVYMHPFWKFDYENFMLQMQNFARNVSLIGASLLCAVALILLGETPLGLTDPFFNIAR